MSKLNMIVNNINEGIYIQLNETLKKLDKKMNLKMYSILFNDKKECKSKTRIKKTLASTKEEIEIIQEDLNELSYIFKELGLDIHFSDDEFGEGFADYCNKQKFRSEFTNQKNFLSQLQKIDNTNEEVRINTSQRIEDSSRIIYMNNLSFEFEGKLWMLYFIIEIRNVEVDIIDIFYKLPAFSLLRMILDYYFIDYFVEDSSNKLKIENQNLIQKYNEDSLQFIRRITRLYFGKLQDLMVNKIELKEIEQAYKNVENNQYYFNDMIEKIDDISNLTYEGQSPFGSILFLSDDLLKENYKCIDYTIKFDSSDIVLLNDSKLVRKLLELTDLEKDIYLISDNKRIYGLGTLNWDQIANLMVIRIDFTGVSKYNIQLLSTRSISTKKGQVVIEKGTKIYSTKNNLEIIDKNLLKVYFKNPIIGGDGSSSERFVRLIKSEYFNDDIKMEDEDTEYLSQIINYAKEQKHGTMVVITDFETAISELKTLKKQSILIEPTRISPEYIQYLTSIDGAIYFDTNGNCHAIGVILDGIANESIGDSSRGARYNSAYKYLEKLRSLNKKCIIVVISEDGIVNLIPDTDSQEKIYELFQKLIDLINENNEKTTDELKEYENNILSMENVDCHLFFKVSEVYKKKGDYENSIKFYEKGFESLGTSIILIGNYRELAYLNYTYGRELWVKSEGKSEIEVIELLKKANKYFDMYLIKENESELTIHDYNDSAIVYSSLSNYEKNESKKLTLLQKGIENFTKAIEINGPYDILYINRSETYIKMGKIKESLDDLIEAELISDKNHIDKILNHTGNDEHLLEYCLQILQTKDKSNSKVSNLVDILEGHISKLSEKDLENVN